MDEWNVAWAAAIPVSDSRKMHLRTGMQWKIWQALAGLILIVATGCGDDNGPPRVAVEGDVTFRGAPVKEGSIEFVPTGGTRGPKAGAAIKDGRYHLRRDEGPVIGHMRVEIRAALNWGYDRSEPEESVQHIGQPVPPNPIPAAYNEQSTLTVRTTAEGENRFDFHLSAGP